MLRPDAKRWSPARPPSLANGQAYRFLTGIPNGHLHLALAAALVAASVIALAIPIARGAHDGAARPLAPVVASNALATALQGQAAAVSGVMAPALTMGSGTGTVLGLQAPGAALVPRPLVEAAARLAARGALGSPEAQTAFAMQRDDAIGFTLHENGFASSQASSQMTVGQALANLGIRIAAHDTVSPSADSELTPGEHIFVLYAAPLRFLLAGQEQTAYTRASTVGGMLAEAGIQLQPMDLVYPGVDAPIQRGMTVSLVTIRDVETADEIPVPFDTVYRYDSELEQGRTVLEQAGSEGAIRRQYRVRQVNGQEARRELVAETALPATVQVIAVGTYVAATPVPEYRPAPAAAAADAGGGDATCARSMHVWATWYTSASAGGSTTATGTGVYRGIVAVDPSVIPLGTQMYIPGYGYAVAADTGGGVRGDMIDLAYGDNDVYDWHTRWVDICILS